MEFACSESDCSAIQGTGGCTHSGSVASRASVAMNAYYQARGRNSWNCFFNGTGLITITDPSKKGNVHLIIQSMTLLIDGASNGCPSCCRSWQLQVCLSWDE
jgi:hypothetical protein